MMKAIMLVAVTALAITTVTAPAFAQRFGGRGGCEELRLACMHKDRLGEQGAGNCRRYREQCTQQRQPRGPSCQELRYWCMNKERFNVQGRGYCKQYREQCHGGM